MYKDIGDIEFAEADDANVPVDIWLYKITDEHTEPDNGDGFVVEPEDVGKFMLYADNYMPRKERLCGQAIFQAVCDTEADVKEIIEKFIKPLYQTALKVLDAISTGDTKSHLYYWKEKELKEQKDGIQS